MPSKDFLVTEPGLTYFAYAQRITPQQIAVANKEDMFNPNARLQIAPYTQKLQRQLRANFNKFYNIT